MPRCRWRYILSHIGCHPNLHIAVLCCAYAMNGKKIIHIVKNYLHNFTLNSLNDFVTTTQISNNEYYNSRIVHSQSNNSVMFERVIRLQTHGKQSKCINQINVFIAHRDAMRPCFETAWALLLATVICFYLA